MAERTDTLLDIDRFYAWAHQGGPGDSSLPGNLGNAMVTFKNAWNLGFTDLEADIRAANKDADPILVLAHDPTLPDGRHIADLTPEDLDDAQRNGHPLVRLDDFLKLFLEELPGATIGLDAKWDERYPADQDPAARLCVGAVRRINAFDQVVVSSFDDQRVNQMRDLSPRGTVSTLSEHELFGLIIDLASPDTPPQKYTGQIASVPLQYPDPTDGHPRDSVTPESMAGAHERGLRVHVWTINDAPTMRHLLDLGVDGIYTDKPEVLKAVLEEPGRPWALAS